jgi:hypothetical protein
MLVGYKIRLLFFLLWFSQLAFGQSKDTILRLDHPGRFRLDLPGDWMHRHKLMNVITDILPETIDELKDRDFCTEGTASYYVKLLMDSISAGNIQTPPPVEISSRPYYTTSFDYSFYGALAVYDSLLRPVAKLRLVSDDEIFTYTNRFSTPAQNVTYRTQYVYGSSGRIIGIRRVEEGRAVNTYIPKVNPWQVITPDFLAAICEKRIIEIAKMLKKLNPE